MDVFFVPLLSVVRLVLIFLNWAVLIGIGLNWLIVLRVVNPYQPVIESISHMYYALTHPIYRVIRRFVPMWGAIDLAPVVFLLTIFFAQGLVERLLQRLA